MDSDKNNVDFNFRSYDDNRDTDLSVNVNGENVTEAKLKKLLNTWLVAIDSKLTVS
jgi:hypothetical protein